MNDQFLELAKQLIIDAKFTAEMAKSAGNDIVDLAHDLYIRAVTKQSEELSKSLERIDNQLAKMQSTGATKQ